MLENTSLTKRGFAYNSKQTMDDLDMAFYHKQVPNFHNATSTRYIELSFVIIGILSQLKGIINELYCLQTML